MPKQSLRRAIGCESSGRAGTFGMAGTSASPMTRSLPSPGRATPGEAYDTGRSGSSARGTCCDLSPPCLHLAAPRGGESVLKSAWPSSTSSSSCWAAAAATAAADSAHSSSRGGSPWSARHWALRLVTALDLERARQPGSSACCCSSSSSHSCRPGGDRGLLLSPHQLVFPSSRPWGVREHPAPSL